MLHALLLAMRAAGATGPVPLPDTTLVYDGSRGQLEVTVPRVDAETAVDGVLDEPVWQAAAMLRGFSQYAPSDGIRAADSTQVLVWYSPTAIHFGIRAFEAHGAVHATLADRDRIFSDDNVQLFLSTFNDGRQAMLFAVNPLGVQADGTLIETGRSSGTGVFGGGDTGGREPSDLSPDYTFQSKGRLTGYGYEVEVRIPFKSLRYQSGTTHRWGLNVVRDVQHSGYEDVWAPAKRASTSFLAQSGTLAGLTDLRRGVVVDINPELTSKVIGGAQPGGWRYDVKNPQIGGNVRWGITNNLTLNGTANPDFSQVESDAGQIAFDPRLALFFAEKRPFFLDGIELFNIPNQLIYTRRIVQPVAAVKLTGKVAGTTVALLSAVDDPAASATGTDHPIYNLLRAQRDVGRQSRIGLAYTDRIDGDNSNRVADVDGRVAFGGVYAAQFQLAGSRTRMGDTTITAPLWQARLDRTGHTVGLRSSFAGIGEGFRTASGFVGRPGIVRALVNPSATLYGRRGGLVERFTAAVALDGTWQYRKFIHGQGIQDQKLHFNGNVALRGGWGVGAGLFIESFGYDSALYANYAVVVARAGGGRDTIPFTGVPTIPNAEGFVQITTPQFARFDGNIFVLYGHDENFYEWSSSKLLLLQGGINWRPTGKLRVELSYFWLQVNRRSDGSQVGAGHLPRLKLEYQLSRPIFLRIVGQYQSQQRDSLRDDSRTDGPLFLRDPSTGAYTRLGAQSTNVFRADVLFSYHPTPGTVLFAGYGSTLEEPRPFRFGDLTRTNDGFFAKVSYLFRL